MGRIYFAVDYFEVFHRFKKLFFDSTPISIFKVVGKIIGININLKLFENVFLCRIFLYLKSFIV